MLDLKKMALTEEDRDKLYRAELQRGNSIPGREGFEESMYEAIARAQRQKFVWVIVDWLNAEATILAGHDLRLAAEAEGLTRPEPDACARCQQPVPCGCHDEE